MTLKERLNELQGERVKIGGMVGFFYCGEVFQGIDSLLDEIGRNEKDRLEKAYLFAKRSYDDWENLYKQRLEEYHTSIVYQKKCIAESSRIINALIEIREQLKEEINQLPLEKRSDLLRRQKVNEQEIYAARRKKYAHENTLKCNLNGLRVYETEQAKIGWERELRTQLEKTADDYERYTSLSDSDVRAERNSIEDFGVKIIILDSSIRGSYWTEKECNSDVKFQIKVSRAKRNGGQANG